ncbi:MAG: hypothetical protein ACLUPQ_18055 [Phocaeicola vulgatus]|jgi:hypothetical protein|uniref:Phage ABA sandwich domain-containing protein n=1 Tax=Phocaeicola vulgatus TaxID=821 RepID=A0A7K0JCN4_PHOVU|nr:hypothetical protein [Phocaeicola vulgatus]MSS47754.1 hypothetical protein [Phocaeicola vulgatus]DAY48893.1 MAG TPA: hypothetical protein [Caudoviricetes sp.]
MTEEFVTLETAKLLKEKGFKEDVFTFYEVDCVEGDMILSETYDESENFNEKNDCLSAPTQSLAQKWLRETKNIHICVYNCACGYGYEISKADNGTHMASSVYKGTNDGEEWDSYEEALEAGLQEALKLI